MLSSGWLPQRSPSFLGHEQRRRMRGRPESAPSRARHGVASVWRRVRPIQRWARLFSKQTLLRAVRVMGPTLVALSFVGVAHAQGTMDFSGATTLMTTFKTFAV